MKLLLALFCSGTLAAQTPWESYILGNPGDVVRPTKGGAVLMGGGKDVEEAFRWLVDRSGGGDIVVLRAGGTNAYNPFIMGLGNVDSVETLILRDRGASSDPRIIEKVKNAEALWFAGGDQWNYVSRWKDTPLHEAIQWVIDQGRPVGGTSAGEAILGEFYFSAEKDGITSELALADPFHEKVAIGKGFLRIPHLEQTITDQHFTQRSRFGRTLTFMARVAQDHGVKNLKGIAVDERTAVLLEPDGKMRVVGTNAAFFLRTTEPPAVCERGKPLTLRNVEVRRVTADGQERKFVVSVEAGKPVGF